MIQNKFKIIVPSFNNQDWVNYNIASILNQTYTNYEVLYIDDASKDETYNSVNELVGTLDNWKVIKNEVNKGATSNYFENLDEFLQDSNDIIVHLDGDDWFYDDNVLEKLNDFYNKKDCWMTYGGFVCFDGSDQAGIPYPQSTEYVDFIHDNKLYRKDEWRASHMRTYKTFLYKSLNRQDLKSLIDGEYYWHASDLAFQYPYMEMCPKDKIGLVDFYTYVYNQSKANTVRTQERESSNNYIYENEIRNRKHYKENLSGEKFPQINVYYDYLEYCTIPKTFTYTYKQEVGEYDMVLICDWEIPNYVSGKIKVNTSVPIVARLLEHRSFFKDEIYNCVLENYDKFDVILTYDKSLLETLPNARFMPSADVVSFNMMPNPNGHAPFKNLPESKDFSIDESTFQVYEKTKLVSVIASDKSFLPGHVKRLNFLNKIKNKLDVFGTCQNVLFGQKIRQEQKFLSLKDYAFSVAIENVSHEVDDYYFTEKIVDCFITGTVPIYYGCKNIGKFFDPKGILTFTNEEELDNIIDNLSMDLYYSMIDHVRNNYEASIKMNLTNDLAYKYYYKDIIDNFKK